LGVKQEWNESYRGPLNRGAKELPQQDVLNEILRDPNSYLMHERWGEQIWNIVLQLKQIRDAEPEHVPPNLIAEIGEHQLFCIRFDANTKQSNGFLFSSLGWVSLATHRYAIEYRWG